MENNLYTFRKYDYLDMKMELMELFEHIAYIDNCSVGKTDDMERELRAIYNNINKIRSILSVKYLFPVDNRLYL